MLKCLSEVKGNSDGTSELLHRKNNDNDEQKTKCEPYCAITCSFSLLSGIYVTSFSQNSSGRKVI